MKKKTKKQYIVYCRAFYVLVMCPKQQPTNPYIYLQQFRMFSRMLWSDIKPLHCIVGFYNYMTTHSPVFTDRIMIKHPKINSLLCSECSVV